MASRREVSSVSQVFGMILCNIDNGQCPFVVCVCLMKGCAGGRGMSVCACGGVIVDVGQR